MGQAMTSETLSISGNDGHRYWVGLQAKPSSRGWKKTVYKGVLLGCGPRQWEKVVAKSFSSIPGTKESWSHEVKKADVAKQLAVEFAEACPSEFKIRVVIPGLVQMDKVSKVNKWLEHRHGHRSLDKDDWISIEEHIPGHVYRFCPWREAHDSDDDEVMASDHLQTFSHFTYKQTNGDMVACDFQGISEDDTYIFTDSIIHSRLQSYGPFDAGDFGMTEFFKRHRCTRHCKDWPKPTPLTPPPSFDDDDDDRHTGTRHVRFDLTRFENVVFPSQRLKVKGKRKGARSPGSRRRHASDHDTTRRREERGWHALTDEEQEQCRRFAYPSLSVPEDNPPAYSECDNTSSSRALGGANTLVSSVSLDEITGNSSSFKHFANYENTRPCASLCSTRRSCLKKNHSEQHNDVHTTKGFTLLPANESCNNAGLREKKSLVSMGEPQTDSSKVTFELGVPVQQWHSHKTTTSSANKNRSTSGKSVPSREKIEEEESKSLEDSETLDSKSSVYSCTSSGRHVHQHDSSRPPASLIERRISKEKGNNSKPDLSFTTLDELKLNLPPLQPSAPRLSDS